MQQAFLYHIRPIRNFLLRFIEGSSFIGRFIFSFFSRLNKFRPILFRLIGLILRPLISGKCVRVCNEGDRTLTTFQQFLSLFSFLKYIFVFPFFRFRKFLPILYRLIGLIFCRLMSEKSFCVLVCIEWNGGINAFC